MPFFRNNTRYMKHNTQLSKTIQITINNPDENGKEDIHASVLAGECSDVLEMMVVRLK